jgi:CheY-like chemotaxis protein
MNAQQKKQLSILLADDDTDDRFFFAKALQALSIPSSLKTVENGELLITYLLENSENLPDVLFLDLNMPMKNGSECLLFIKKNEKLKKLPVIIYSTSLHVEIADLLYKNGAHYYIRKTELPDLKKVLSKVLPLILAKNLNRPSREEFVLSLQEI